MRALITLLLLLPALHAQTTGSYFPLEVGDRWVYRTDDRFFTARYETWRIDRTETIDAKQYFALAVYTPFGLIGESKFRVGEQGRILILTGNGDQLFLDPRVGGENGQLHPGNQGGSYKTAVGTFSDTITYTNPMGLLMENGMLGRGVGLLWSTTNL